MAKASFGGALGGAASGAALGSSFGPIGTGIGALGGGLLGLFGGGGKKGKMKQLSNLTPEQKELMALITQGLSQGEGPLKDLFGQFDRASFEEGVAQPELKRFREETLPTIMEKFIAGNQVGGSGMQRAALRAGTDLQSKLAELSYKAQQQQQQNRLQGLQTGLGTRALENIYRPGTEGPGQSFFKGLAPGIGQGIGSQLAGGFQQSAPGAPKAAPIAG